MTQAPVEWAAVAPPSEMQRAPRWLLYRIESRTRPDGTTASVKVPCYITGDRRRGDLDNDAAQLVDYAQARAALSLFGGSMAGLGFALGDGWQGVDFDHCDLRPDLAALVDGLPGYVEVSPSRTGVHAIGYGAPFDALGSNASGIEAYSRGRFFTFTGWALRNGPIVDLGPYVVGILAPRHAAHRKVGPVQPRPPVAETGDRVLDELADALRYIDADDRDAWIGVGQALYPLGDAGYALWAAWSGTSGRFPGGDDLERWETFKGERTGYAAVFNRAAAGGWKNPRKLDAAAIFAGSGLVVEAAGIATPAPIELGGGGTTTQVATASTPMIPPVPDHPPVPAERLGGKKFLEEGGGGRASSIENVVDVLGPESGVRLAFDRFQGVVMIGAPSGEWRVITDNDYGRMRETLGRGGFKPVSAEVMSTAVDLVAERNSFDSAITWCESLAWDGVSRIDTAMHRYFGTEDTPYARAVGAYLFTALAGRALVPGCQADMALVLIGLQGARKTSAIAALSPTPEAFGEVNLGKTDEQIAYVLRGKLVIELAEMRGVTGRDQEATKAWVTRRTEEWREPYRRMTTKYRRRSIIVGTANEHELFDDPTGERRWLPVLAGQTQVEALEADRGQLWAEGVVRFKANGIEWQAAEQLGREEHPKFKVSDEWAEIVGSWLASTSIPKLGEIPSPVPNGEKPVALHVIATEALGLRKSDLTMREEKRIGKILRYFGYEKKVSRENGVLSKRWQRATPA